MYPIELATILNISLQLVANLAIAFEPFLPFSSEKLRKMLNMESFDWEQLGRTDLLAEGHQLDLYNKYFPNGAASIFTFEVKGGQEKAQNEKKCAAQAQSQKIDSIHFTCRRYNHGYYLSVCRLVRYDGIRLLCGTGKEKHRCK